MQKIIYTISLLSFLFTHYCGYGQTYYIGDPEFKKCIENSFPTAIDVQGNLILSEAAIPDSLDCSSYSITNIDGLQHFTNLKVIDLHNNNLSLLKGIDALALVEELYVQENELVELPDFSNSTHLKILEADNNFITTAPNLPSQLRLLNLGENNLTSLGDLSSLSELEYLLIYRNTNLKEIPSFEGLTKLKELQCYLCGLNSLPTLSMLTNIEYLNIGYNNFTSLPDLSSNKKLLTLYANNCSLNSFPDLSSLPLLQKVRLYNNYLSFEDFIPLLVDTNYSEVYKIIPQNNFTNPLAPTYFEYDSVSFKTGLAAATLGTNYTWYFKGEVLYNSEKDTLVIDSIQIKNSGKYSFTITNSFFPELILISDTQDVVVNSCLNPTGFEFEITGVTCQKAGTLKIIPTNQPQENLTFILQSTATDRQFNSTKNEFKNLNNPEYKLYASAGKRCIKLINSKILLPIEPCKEAFFTPNNDGIDDSYFFEQVGEAKIYNKWGQLIQTLKLPNEWHGELRTSEKISPGYYTIDINDGEEIFHLSVVY